MMRRPAFRITAAIIFSAVIFRLGALAIDGYSPEQHIVFPPSFRPEVTTHETQTDRQSILQSADARETAAELDAVSSAPPTRSSFMAKWANVSGANGYLLDVSTTESFDNYVEGYHDLDVANVAGRVVTGLNPGTTYYYRVRPYDGNGPGNYSEVMTGATVATSGLTIQATFDNSITGNPNAAAIEAMINRAIAIYEFLFTDPITVHIHFRYATTAPNGTPLPQGVAAQSLFVYYVVPWSTYIDALRRDAKTDDDRVAIASVGNYFFTSSIHPSSADGRAVGLDTEPALFANGTVGSGGPYDGIVTLNSAVPYRFIRPTNAASLDAQRTTEHEIDEVLGLGSRLNTASNDLRPQDLFTWASAGTRNITSTGTRYLSINGGVTNIVNLNQDPHGDFGDWLSAPCPQRLPYVQNAFACRGQFSDVTPTSPEGVNLDVLGYDLSDVSGFFIPDTTCRGMVFDFAGENLYASTSTGLIKQFNLLNGGLTRTYNLHGSLNGIDIARNNSFILAAQNNYDSTQGTIHRLNLATGIITNIHYPRTLHPLAEGGVWDVAISSNGKALFSTLTTGGSGFTPLHQIDLTTNTTTTRTDAPGSEFNGLLETRARLHRSANAMRLLVMEGGGQGPVFTYSAVTDTFSPSFRTNADLNFGSGAVNRTGNLIGLRKYGPPASLRRVSDLSVLHNFNAIDGGIAFDTARDILYGVSSTTEQIIAYDTNTYAELFRLNIGEQPGPAEEPFGRGMLVASADGRWLALQSVSGIRVLRVPNSPPHTAEARLRNISTRALVRTGENVMIGGFIVQGPGPKRVIIRAIGPELTQYGITNALANPRLELYNGTNTLIGSNDNWQTTVLGGVIPSNQASVIQNSGHAPAVANESAIIADLQPGNYTAVVRGVNNASGVALVEVYDLSPTASSSLRNISTRSAVETGQNLMIGGFVVQGAGAKRVIIRAIGPELTQHGISNALADPHLELHNGTGALIASNDNWQTTIPGGVIAANQVTDIQNSGHAPTSANESAIIANLHPGNYTAIVRGVNNTAGVALVEVYDLN